MSKLVIATGLVVTASCAGCQKPHLTLEDFRHHGERSSQRLGLGHVLKVAQVRDEGNAIQLIFSGTPAGESISITYYDRAMQRLYWYNNRLSRYNLHGAPSTSAVIRTRTDAIAAANRAILGFNFPFRVMMGEGDVSFTSPRKRSDGRIVPGLVKGIGRPRHNGLPIFAPHGIAFKIDVRDGMLLSAMVDRNYPRAFAGRAKLSKLDALQRAKDLKARAELGYRPDKDGVARLVWEVTPIDGGYQRYFDAETGRMIEDSRYGRR